MIPTPTVFPKRTSTATLSLIPTGTVSGFWVTLGLDPPLRLLPQEKRLFLAPLQIFHMGRRKPAQPLRNHALFAKNRSWEKAGQLAHKYETAATTGEEVERTSSLSGVKKAVNAFDRL